MFSVFVSHKQPRQRQEAFKYAGASDCRTAQTLNVGSVGGARLLQHCLYRLARQRYRTLNYATTAQTSTVTDGDRFLYTTFVLVPAEGADANST